MAAFVLQRPNGIALKEIMYSANLWCLLLGLCIKSLPTCVLAQHKQNQQPKMPYGFKRHSLGSTAQRLLLPEISATKKFSRCYAFFPI